MRFLKLHHVEKCNVPFIATYRKEQCSSLLKDLAQPQVEGEIDDKETESPKLKWHKVLWAIKELDSKWLLLQKHKSARLLYYKKRYEKESRRVHDEVRLTMNQQIFESVTKSLKNAELEREVDDIDLKFNLHFDSHEVSLGEGQFKRPSRRSSYRICSRSGLWEVASKFGCSAEQLGLQITLEKVEKEATKDLRESPDEIASNFLSTMYDNPQAVLRGARLMAAIEISCEPCLRKHVRHIFMCKAVVSTSPTHLGNTAIDSFHQLAGVKWLCEKRLVKFEDTQWLLIQKAEECKLLNVTIRLPKSKQDELMDQFSTYYLSEGVSIIAQLWNEQRKLILQESFSVYLFPSMEKEARIFLTIRAKKWLLMEYGKHLWDRVSVAPHQCREHGTGQNSEATPRVMSCCWGPGIPATTFVMLDSSGELLDWMPAGSLGLQSKNANEQHKKDDEQRLLKFMMDHQPHVVVLGAANLFCKQLKEEIYEIIFKMVEEKPRDVSQEMDGINIVYGDESLSRIYEHSRISSDQLPGQPGIVRRAVALGRYLQNPLAMISTLCGLGREILSWKINSFDHLLTDDEKFEMVEQVMMDVTNQVGIDLNLAASHNWLFAPLQFISGLGPRKAVALQRKLVRAGSVTSRKDLISHGLGTLKVFKNAIGFLRVRCSGMATSPHDFDLLDDTRIHPESYSLAKVMAGIVYRQHVEDDSNDDVMLEMAVEYLRDHPALLKSFVVNAYAEDYAKKNKRNRRDTLNDIKMELLCGFQDRRSPYKELSQDEEFYLLSSENVESFAEGSVVQATVRRVDTDRAICVLQSGLIGTLYKNDFVEQPYDVDLTNEIQQGDVLTCKIRQIQRNRYQVILTCKESDLKSTPGQNLGKVDPYYHEQWTHVLAQQEKCHKVKLAKKSFRPRMIVHPYFQNITSDEAMEFLSDKDVGEIVFHPSSRGLSYLTLTLKMYNGFYAHKIIVEGWKNHNDITSLLRLGTTLTIGDENFQDLDEVVDRYVDPLVCHLKAMLCYRKFRAGSQAQLDDFLRAEKSTHPMRIVYCFGIPYQHPGAFVLSFIRNTNPHHEYISLYPGGFKFRKRMFVNIDQLVAYFQKHVNDLHNMPYPSIQSVAAVVPMRSPSCRNAPLLAATDNSWRGGNDSNGVAQVRDTGMFPRSNYRQWCGSYNSIRDNNGGDGRKDSSTTIKMGLESWEGQKAGNDWSSFAGAKGQNSPGQEAFLSEQSSSEYNSRVHGNWGHGGSSGHLGINTGGNGIVNRGGDNASYSSSYWKRKSSDDTSSWGSNAKVVDGGDHRWSSFQVAKTWNSTGKQALPCGWGNTVSDGGWGKSEKSGANKFNTGVEDVNTWDSWVAKRSGKDGSNIGNWGGKSYTSMEDKTAAGGNLGGHGGEVDKSGWASWNKAAGSGVAASNAGWGKRHL